MKYLELDARHPECRGLARALVGSQCALSRPAARSGRIGFELVQILQDVFLVCRGDENPKWESVTPHQSIYIPIDTLKLCPFVAFREGVSVIASDHWLDDNLTSTGPIAYISGNIGGVVGIDVEEHIMGRITLDLESLPKGARIVEVEK